MPNQEERARIESGIPATWDSKRLLRETYITTVANELTTGVIKKKVECIDGKVVKIKDGEIPRLKKRVRTLEAKSNNGKPTEGRPRNGIKTKGKHRKNGRGITGHFHVDVGIIVTAVCTLVGLCVYGVHAGGG